MSLLTYHNNHHHHQTPLFSHLPNTTSSKTLSKTLNPFFFFPKPTKINSYNNINQHQHQEHEEEEEHVIGDCLVFEQGIFDDPFIQTQIQPFPPKPSSKTSRKIEVKPEDLIPDNWKNVQAEINITKKERRKMAQEMEFGTKLQKRREGLEPIPMGYATAKDYKAAKLQELKPLVLDNPNILERNDEGDVEGEGEGSRGVRVAPRNPKMAVYGRSLDDISRFLNSGRYDPDAANDPQGQLYYVLGFYTC